MSNAIFPTLPGLQFNNTKTPRFNTRIQTATSGKELRAAFWTYPIWDFTLSYEFLRQNNANVEFSTLCGFFLSRKGSYDSFLYSDPSDNTATLLTVGVGDGITTAWQMTKSFGGFIEPIAAFDGTPTLYRTDWQGTQQLYSTARTNLCLQSQTLGTTWAQTAVTVVTDAAASLDGTFTLDKIAETAVNSEHFLEQTFTPSAGSWCVSALVKSAERTKGILTAVHVGEGAPTSSCTFDLSAGTITGASARITASGIEAKGGGLYRVWATFTTTVACTSLRVRIQSSDGTISYLGALGSGIYAGCVQFETGTVPTPYLGPTTTAALTRTDYTITSTGLVTLASTTNPVASQGIGTASGSSASFTVTAPNASTPTVLAVYRTDWQGRQRMYATARTNLCLYSSTFADASWTKTNVTDSGAVSGPSGSSDARSYTATGFAQLTRTVAGLTAGQPYVLFVWARCAAGATSAKLGTTEVASSALAINATWSRISVPFTAAGASTAIYLLGANSAWPSGTTLEIADVQLELGSTATSYIPTTTTAVTVTDYSATGGAVTMAFNPVAGAVMEADYTYVGGLGVGNVLSWTGKYYYRVRFKQDMTEFSQFVSNFWEAKRVEFVSVK